ncbi:hypothetical protein D3P96_06555 [Weissella viridescens]|uniref:NAD(P)-binding domain-containing protein n=1 Tax=Weissella viridescens TaxID=1629 RepID=A0A3P2R9W9_WEIVI|nr:NAD(P)H-binding protein [Weissella viridescens]RRG17609.1 hypothetical protein D3P96_06555 [Weissella viridescens]
MQITLTGSLGHISRPVAEQLVADGHEVTIITRNEKRKADIEAMGAKAAVGSIEDLDFLIEQFRNQDAVYLMLAGGDFKNPNFDVVETAQKQADIYQTAVKEAQVKHVVNLSSIGADQGPEVGGLYTYHIIEDVLRMLDLDSLIFIRPTGMYYNLYANYETLAQTGKIYGVQDPDFVQTFVAPEDVAPVVVAALEKTEFGEHVYYVDSDEVTGRQIATILGDAIGIPDAEWIQISGTQVLENMQASGISKGWAQATVQMLTYMENSKFRADYNRNKGLLGPTKLINFASDFQKYAAEMKKEII